MRAAWVLYCGAGWSCGGSSWWAMAAGLYLAELGRRKNGRWQRGSVPEPPHNPGTLDTGWAEQMRQVGLVLDYLPGLADDVLTGSLALDAA